MSVPSSTPVGHTTPAPDTPDSGAITPSRDSPAPTLPLRTRVIRRGRFSSWPGPKLRAEPTGPRAFAFGTNDAAATWAYGVATSLDLRPSHIRVYKAFASFGEAEKDAQGTRIGDYGTWASICPTIKTVMRVANVSRSVVDRAVAELKDLRLMAEEGEAASGAKIYRLTGTPEHPLPEAVVRQRALAAGELWFGEPLPAAEQASGSVDEPVDNSGSLIFEHRSDVPSELGTDAQPKSSTDFPPLTPGTEPLVFEEDGSIARPGAEGVRSVPSRAKSERQAALTKKPPTAPKGRPTNPRGTRKAPERHAEPRTLVEWALMELTERMTPFQRADTLAMARAVLAGEAITEEQLVHRLRANLRMIGGGNRSTSPYGFAKSPRGLFRKPFGCDDPYCEDGDVFTATPGQAPTKCPRCAERRMDRAAKRRQDQAQPWWGQGTEEAAPPARGPRHPSDLEQPWCGICDQRTRHVEIDFWERDPAPCPRCAPVPTGTIPRQGTPSRNLTDPLGT